MQTGYRVGAWGPWLALVACSCAPPSQPLTSDTAGTTIAASSTSPSAPDETTGPPLPADTTEGRLSTSTAGTTEDTTGPADGSSDTGLATLPCNGHVELCDRPFDQVVFPGTHNSHSTFADGFPVINANQEHGIVQQLADGIRVLLIDVYPDPFDPAVVLMCHGRCILASTPHRAGLDTIVQFLEDNPREVLTIIYEDHVGKELLAQDFAATGAEALTFVHSSGEPWPTLAEMIAADTRLLVTAESAGPPPAWLHHVWDEAWDTPYGPTEIDGLSCALNRGSPEHDLFLVNHWVNTPLGLPSMDNAAIVNAADVLLSRALECQTQWDHPPNFLVVDFYEQGDLLAVVDELNGL